MGMGEEAEHMCVLVYGGFSGDAVEGDLISIDPGACCSFSHSFDLRFGILGLAYAWVDVSHANMPIELTPGLVQMELMFKWCQEGLIKRTADQTFKYHKRALHMVLSGYQVLR